MAKIAASDAASSPVVPITWTIRALAAQLGVGAMSIYHYLPNKDRILDAMVDAVFAEIEVPQAGEPWRAALYRRTTSARQALRRHSWAIGLMDSRAHPGPATLRHHDAVIGCLRANGFSIELTAHTFVVIDAYLYGFSVQAASLPFSDPDEMAAVADGMVSDAFAEDYPHLLQLARDYSLRAGYTFEDEFSFGLDLVLDGIERGLGS